MRKFLSFWRRLLVEECGEVAVTPGEPAAAADPAPVSADPTPSSDPAPGEPAPEPINPGEPGDNPTLDDLLKGTLGDEPAPGDPNQPGNTTIPQEWTQVSPFVTSPESIPQAIQAADEVWKVATGQLPARQMLEGFRAQNPAQFEAIANDLRDYLGVQGQQQSANPLESLKAENPQVYQAVAQYIQQQTGKTLDGSQDPYAARLAAIEQQYAAEREARQQEAYQAQVQQADGAAHEFLSTKLKGTWAEGENDYFIAQIARNLGPQGVQKSMQEVLNGNTATLEKAYKAVMREEMTRVKKYSDAMVAAYKKQKNMVPASKGNVVNQPSGAGEPPARKEGESLADYAKRVWDSGYTA